MKNNILKVISILLVSIFFTACTHLETGKSYYNQQKYKKAKVEFELYTKENPQDMHGFNRLGWTNYHLGNYQLAIKLFQKANKIKIAPFNYNGIADSYNKLKEYNKSREYNLKFKKFLLKTKLFDSYWLPFNRLGWNYLNLNNPKKSIENFKKSLSYKQKVGSYEGLLISYMRLGNFKESLSKSSKYLELAKKNNDKKHITSSYNKISNIYFLSSNYGKAIEYGLKSIKSNSKQILAYTLLSSVYLKVENYELAMKYVNIPAEKNLNIDSHWTYYNILGWNYFYNKNFNKAIESFIKSNSIKETPHNNYALWKIYAITDKNKEKYYLKKTKNIYDDFIINNKYILKSVILNMEEIVSTINNKNYKIDVINNEDSTTDKKSYGHINQFTNTMFDSIDLK